MTNRTCIAADCDGRATRKGMCGKHYDRVRRIGSMDLPVRTRARCQVDACENLVQSNGVCNLHYLRIAKYGSPRTDIPVRKLPLREQREDVRARILAKSERVGDCIEWRGYAMPSGYGTISWRSRQWVVHRAMWTVMVGPIPTDDDWTLDHLCRNKLCVNVEHLEVVTRTENSLRAGGLAIAHGRTKQKFGMVCFNGHKRTRENTGTRPNGGRKCLICAEITRVRRTERRHAAARARRGAA